MTLSDTYHSMGTIVCCDIISGVSEEGLYLFRVVMLWLEMCELTLGIIHINDIYIYIYIYIYIQCHLTI